MWISLPCKSLAVSNEIHLGLVEMGGVEHDIPICISEPGYIYYCPANGLLAIIYENNKSPFLSDVLRRV